MRRDSAELFIIYQLRNRRVLTTHRTLRILSQFELAKLHRPRIKHQQSIDQEIFRAENNLDRFVRLDRTDDPWQHTEHTALRARGHQTRRRRFRIQTAIARTLLRTEDTCLPFKPEARTVNVSLPA